MTNVTLTTFSAELADRTEAGAQSVVQVAGSRRPASGVVYGSDTIITTARAIGREDGLRVRLPDNTQADADLAGWDPASGIAVLRTRTALSLPPPALAEKEPRTGEIVLAIARSWSNAVTASCGNVAVVGGPLRTGRRGTIDRVIRVTALVHEGFSGGGVFDTAGDLVGIATAAHIRGFGVVIPAAIAWSSASRVLATGTPRRGFIGVAVQPVELRKAQQRDGRERGLLIVAVTPSSPADAAGIDVGDLLLDVDGKPVESPDDLLDVLGSFSEGRTLSTRILRGGGVRELELTVGAR